VKTLKAWSLEAFVRSNISYARYRKGEEKSSVMAEIPCYGGATAVSTEFGTFQGDVKGLSNLFSGEVSDYQFQLIVLSRFHFFGAMPCKDMNHA
jgi:hypothetical protein